MNKRVAALLIILCAACAPTNAPNELVALGSVRLTATIQAGYAQATAAPATQNAANEQFSQRQTEMFAPLAITATQNSNDATAVSNVLAAQRAESESRANEADRIAVEQEARLLVSNTEKRIAQNNASIAESVYRADAMQFVCYGGAGAIVVFCFALALGGAWQAQGFFLTVKSAAQHRVLTASELWEARQRRTYEAEAPALPAPATIANKHAGEYRSSHLRGLLKTYVGSCINLSRDGIEQPFSRPNCARYVLITHPARDGSEYWQLGHSRTVAALIDVGVLVSTGGGGPVVFAPGVDADNYSAKIDTAPLPNFLDPLPSAKIVLAGSQVMQELAS